MLRREPKLVIPYRYRSPLPGHNLRSIAFAAMLLLSRLDKTENNKEIPISGIPAQVAADLLEELVTRSGERGQAP
ncbi:hypothetical protein [Gloeobacter kilaueensis]|uniref:hypothetical protein n=1 Tax=Gloeobacter kilaueensis TaxID=1416614 RepID=UPI001182B676|nr:hypothetical protein [Gloeobacter kilaueensis]